MFAKQAIPAGRKQKILPCLVGRQTLPMRSEPAENSRAHIGILLPSRLYCRLRNRTGSCLSARGLRGGKPHHRRSGISPCPEGCIAIIHYAHYTTFHSKTSSIGDPNPICCSPQQAGRKQKKNKRQLFRTVRSSSLMRCLRFVKYFHFLHHVAVFHRPHDVHARCHLAKDGVHPIQVRLRLVDDKELAAAGVAAAVRH